MVEEETKAIKKVVAIHQPEHLPWLGFFHKMYSADEFVLLDNVQFKKNNFQNRNRIRTADGWCWVTVPILIKRRSKQKINEVLINPNVKNWAKKIWHSIKYNYHRAEYFNQYEYFFFNTYCQRKWQRLLDLNINIIKQIKDFFGIKTKLSLASELNVDGKGSDLLLNICKRQNATMYISGIFGKNYLDENIFLKEQIAVTYQNFKHPTYKQLYEPFTQGMSVIDLLFNYGQNSVEIIRGIK